MRQYQVGDRVEAHLGRVLDAAILVVFLGSGAFKRIGQRSFDFILPQRTGGMSFKGRTRRRSRPSLDLRK
jgi:hypothetical protein